MKNRQKKWKSLGIVVLVFAIGYGLLWYYMAANVTRIQEQNKEYAKSFAAQSAERIGSEFNTALQRIENSAYLASMGDSSALIDVDTLKELENHTNFDAVRYVDRDGNNLSSDGQVCQIQDRSYFKKGMSGASGLEYVSASRINGKPMIVFYAPVKEGGEIKGLFLGLFFAQDYLRSMLTTEYFNVRVPMLLSSKDGTIVASSSSNVSGDPLYPYLLDQKSMSTSDSRQVIDAVNDQKETIFVNEKEGPIENVSVLPVPGYDFMLVQGFPRQITDVMVSNANRSGFILEGCLLILFALLLIYLFKKMRDRRKHLEVENRIFVDVLEGVKILFNSRYLVVDLDQDTYTYMAGSGPINTRIPMEGIYSQFIQYHTADIIGDEEKKAFDHFAQPETLRQNLKDVDDIVHECHVMRNGKEDWEHLIAVCLKRRKGIPTRILYVRTNITDLKNKELHEQREKAIQNRKERQYKVALLSSAFFAFECNLSQEQIEQEISFVTENEHLSLFQKLQIDLPCSFSDFFDRWQSSILPESLLEYQKNMDAAFLIECFERQEMEVEVDYWTSIDDKPTCVRQSFIMSKDEETNEIMAMVVFRNITELVWEKRKQTQALQEALLQARQANFAKTTFLSNMSHDIRTPMNAIIGFSNIALNHIENKEQVQASLEKILSSSQHLLGLINDILDMSQIESGKLQIQYQACDLSQLIYDLLNIVQPQIYEKKMSFHLDVHGVQDVRVSTDPLKLNQVLINILGNALKYTPEGGSIDMKVEQLPGQENHKTWYRFVVKDNGIGMSSEFVAKIFEPFERASSATISGIQGAGLGMPITKNIIEAMHGKIEVESELGKGSVFTVMLPLKIVRGEVLDLVHEKIVLLDSDLEERTQLFEQIKAWNGVAERASNIEDLYRRGERAVCLVDRDHFERMDVSKLLARRLVVIREWDHGNRTFESIDGLPVYFVSRPLFVAHVYPLLYEEDHALVPEDEKLVSVSFEGLRLLLVEDNELNREIAQIVLEEAGFVVECAPDGVDAIEMVQASANRYYDGILMDVQMPLMNGYEATMAIRRLDRKDVKRMPIIAMTANAMEDDIKDSIAAGMDAHISKPIDVGKLMETLSKFFGGQMK